MHATLKVMPRPSACYRPNVAGEAIKVLEILTHLKEGRAEVAVFQLNVLSNTTNLKELIDIGCTDPRIRGDLGVRRARRRLMTAMAVRGVPEKCEPAWSFPVERKQATAPRKALVKLSARQADVLNCLKQGMTSATSGAHLGISKETVKWHVKGLFRALGATNRSSAVQQANLHGLL